jgi:D-alanine--poly(phosphoribitol) ligase subunit 1
VKKASVNIWHSVPSVVPLLAEYGRASLDSLSSLRLATFCGEPLYPYHVKQLLALNANITICNTYGPTEATFFCSFNRLSPSDYQRQPAQSFSIGKPIPGWGFHLEKSNDQGLEELWIVSEFLGKGYIAPTQDQERFTQLPIGNCTERAYRTGDLFCRSELNELVFSGRNDRQIKIRGHRLDLSEIEYQAMECGGSEAKAIASQYGVALFVTISGKTKTELLASLSTTLPAYAIPTDVFLMDQLPRNLNGKIDSQKLQSILSEVRHERE